MKKSHFLVEKGWDWDTPTPLIWILSQVYPKFDRLFLAHFLVISDFYVIFNVI